MQPSYPGLRLPSYYQRLRNRAEKAFEPVVFKPVMRNPFKPQTRILMINSIHGYFRDGSHYNLTAGERYWVDKDKADEFIVKGYASGELSRPYSDDEQASIRASIQVVQMNPGGITNG